MIRFTIVMVAVARPMFNGNEQFIPLGAPKLRKSCHVQMTIALATHSPLNFSQENDHPPLIVVAVKIIVAVSDTPDTRTTACIMPVSRGAHPSKGIALLADACLC